MVGHLKVDAEYQHGGGGTLLLAAGEIHVGKQGWPCIKARLSVLAENRPAQNCYATAGLQQVSSCDVALAEGINDEVKWLQIARFIALKEQRDSVGIGAALVVDEILPDSRPDILQIRSFEPKLKLRACGNRADMGQCFIAPDMGYLRLHGIHVGFGGSCLGAPINGIIAYWGLFWARVLPRYSPTGSKVVPFWAVY